MSRKTGYKWSDRYLHHGSAGLAERSRRPASSPNATPEEIVHKRHPRWDLPGRSTVCDILSRHGMVPKKRTRRKIGHPGHPTSAILAPNDTWCDDFKGHQDW